MDLVELRGDASDEIVKDMNVVRVNQLVKVKYQHLPHYGESIGIVLFIFIELIMVTI